MEICEQNWGSGLIGSSKWKLQHKLDDEWHRQMNGTGKIENDLKAYCENITYIKKAIGLERSAGQAN